MKDAILIYQGFLDGKYSFKNQEGKEIIFSKAKSDLIWDFQLKENINRGKYFRAKFFINNEKFKDIYILCDLEKI